MKALLCSLLAILILVSVGYSGQEVAVALSEDAPETSYKLAWKVPVGDLKPAAVSQDEQSVLLPVLFDGYYLYDSKGRLASRLPDPYAGFGEFSADGNSALLADESLLGLERQRVSLIDARTLHYEWNYTLDMIRYARLSSGSMRAAIVGATPLETGGWQNLLVVKDKNGIDLLKVKFGGEFDLSSPPSISDNGRYITVGSWGREERECWLYFYDLDSGRTWNATIRNGVMFVAMSSNATVVAALGQDRLHLFDRNGQLLWSAPLPDLLGYIDSFPHLWVSDSGEYVAVAGGLVDHGYAMLFDRSGNLLWNFRVLSTVTAFAVDNQASRFVIGDSNGTVYVLDRSGNVLSRRDLVSSVRSVAMGGKSGIMVAVGDENMMYVMDAQTNLLWRRGEIGSSGFNVQTSQDGKRILIVYSSGYSKGTTVLDDRGNVVLNGPVSIYPIMPALSSNGQQLTVATTIARGDEEESVLAWYDVDSSQQLKNVTLGKGSAVDSLSMSNNASLAAVSGVVWNNYTFIYAFDSQGRQLWKQLAKAEELVGYYESIYVRSSVAVSRDGLYVAAALREMTVRFYSVCGGDNGVVLFDNEGKVLWSYTIPECVWNVAISEDGQYVAAASESQIYEFDRDGRLLWSSAAYSGAIAISNTGQKLVAGDIGGRLFLANASGPYWQTEVNGWVESVAVSDSESTTAAVISRDYSSGRTLRQLYLLSDEGRPLGNYSSIGPWQPTGGSRVTISKNECCIVAALETDGIYYFVRTPTETQTVTIPISSTILGTHGTEEIQTIATILLVGALGCGALLFIMKRRFPAKKEKGSS